MRTYFQLLLLLLAFHFGYAKNIDPSFTESSLILETKTGKLYGSLCIPNHYKKGAIVLLIAGSGPTDRNGNSGLTKNNALLQLAHQLADSGIASFRFDKRGIGESAGAIKKEEDLIFDDYISDVSDWMALLKKDKRFNKLIIAGHSEGSLIGMIAASRKTDLFISISGAGEPIDQTLKRQLAKQPDTIKNKSYSIIDSLKQGHLVKDVPLLLYSLFRPSVQPYLINWFKRNPQIEVAKLKIPALIIQGNKDLQVSEDDAKMLHDASPNSKLVIIDNMNHVLKTVSDEKDNYKSYKDANRHLHPELIKVIVGFIKQHSKG